jgi:hypothetical protein
MGPLPEITKKDVAVLICVICVVAIIGWEVLGYIMNIISEHVTIKIG